MQGQAPAETAGGQVTVSFEDQERDGVGAEVLS